MNPDTEPTIVDDLEEAGHATAVAVRKLIDRAPFIDQGVMPFVFLPILFLAVYYQATAFWGAVSADAALYTWKPVTANLMLSGVSGESFVRGGGHGAVSSGSVDSDLDVRYRYAYGNRAYESTSFWLGYSARSGDDLGLRPADWVRDHPKGSRIVVLVNPNNPEMSAVDPCPTFAQALVMLVSMPFTLLGLSGVLTERAQTRLRYEPMVAAWGALTLLIFALGHALTIATCVAIAIYFMAWFVIHRSAHKGWLSAIEEDPNAPPMDITDFDP